MLPFFLAIIFSQYNVYLYYRYNPMIFEALSALKEPNGSDTSAIMSFIEVCLKLLANVLQIEV